MFEQMPSHTENFIECKKCHRLARIKKSDGNYLVDFQNCCEHTRFKKSNESYFILLEIHPMKQKLKKLEIKKSAQVDEFSRQEEYGFRLLILFLFATTCIMLSHRNAIKDPNPKNNDWDKCVIDFYFGYSLAIYGTTIAVIYSSMVVLLTFVSATGVLFAFMKYVNAGIHNWTIFWQTLLIIDAIVLFILVLIILTNVTDKEQKSDINTEEKKSGAAKVFKKYDSMADYVFKYQCLNNVVQARKIKQSV